MARIQVQMKAGTTPEDEEAVIASLRERFEAADAAFKCLETARPFDIFLNVSDLLSNSD